ncbi:MAG: hypothetical protein IKT77_01885 [Paludibacteraceae bacterium]|nr:hypothetical protein [Paludibacteraceae bacterium]
MNIDELKSQWKSMELRIDRLEKDNKQLLSRISNERMKSVREKLLARYRALIIVCIFSPLWMVLMNNLYHIDIEVSIVYAFFFYVMALANFYMCKLIKKVDCSKLTIKDALIAVTKVEEYLRKFQFLGWILGFPLIIIMFDVFKDMGHPEIIYGACVGLVIGGIIGYFYDRKTRRLIRELRQTLADALVDDDEL